MVLLLLSLVQKFPVTKPATTMGQSCKRPPPRRGRDLHIRWWRGSDLNQRPSGYEPDELPDCSTPRRELEGTGTRPETPTELMDLSPTLDVRGSA